MLKKLLSVLITLVSLFVTACDANFEPVGYNGNPAYVYLTNPGTVSVENVASTTGNNTFTGSNNFTQNVTMAGVNGLVFDTLNNTQSMRAGWNVGNLMTGLYNFLFGIQAGAKVTTGEGNTLIGTAAGYNVTVGNYNIAIGDGAMWGINTTTTGNKSVAIGDHSLAYLANGNENTAIGSGALGSIISGSRNVGLGRSAGDSINTGNDNVLLGYLAGQGITTGGQNVMIGHSSGNSLTTETGNIFIGDRVSASITGSNQFVIDSAQQGNNNLYIYGLMGSNNPRYIRFSQRDASSGSPLKDFYLMLRNTFWNGTASVDWDFKINHDMTQNGSIPASNVTFSINGTNIMQLENNNTVAGFFLSANGTLSKVYKGSANSAGTGYAILMVEN